MRTLTNVSMGGEPVELLTRSWSNLAPSQPNQRTSPDSPTTPQPSAIANCAQMRAEPNHSLNDALRHDGDNRAPAIREVPQLLAPLDGGALLTPVGEADAAHEQRADGDEGDGQPRPGVRHVQHGARVGGEHVEAGFVHRLWVHWSARQHIGKAKANRWIMFRGGEWTGTEHAPV